MLINNGSDGFVRYFSENAILSIVLQQFSNGKVFNVFITFPRSIPVETIGTVLSLKSLLKISNSKKRAPERSILAVARSVA